MKSINKEQYTELAQYERYMHQAYYGDYVAGLTLSAATRCFEIYNSIFNVPEHTPSCSRCQLKVMKSLGHLYFTYRLNQELAKRDKEKEKKTNAKKQSGAKGK